MCANLKTQMIWKGCADFGLRYFVAIIFTKFLKSWKSNKPIPFYQQYKGQILNDPKASQPISQTKTMWRSSETRTQ